MKNTTPHNMTYSWILSLGAMSLWVSQAYAVLPAAVTNQPILFVVRNQYQTDHHNTHTMFPSALNETNTGYYEGGNSALKVFDPATGLVRTILDAGATGVVRDPDVHFSGTRIVFAWRKSLADCYHIYEINTDGSGLKQLTALPDVDDFDPIYMPDDRIVFVSGREPKYVMCNKHLSHNLYRMDADGANITQIAKSTLFEGHPSLMSDGRILYDRWEYVDRDFGDAQGLWTSDPEGTEHAIYFGNNTSSPGGVLDAQEIPGTHMAVCTFVACHDKPWGAIAIIDRRLARDGAPAVVRTWPDGLASLVKVNSVVNGDYDIFATTSPKQEDPFPLTDPTTGVGGRYFLCSRNTGVGEHMALYLLDATDGSATLLHDEGSGDVGCFDPMPLAARRRPGIVTSPRKYDDTPGRFYVMDVYKGTHMTGVARGTVKYLRVVESPEKRYYSSQVWNAQGIEAPGVNWDSFETKRILGTVPVEADGSAHFLVPPRTFVFFQLLDAQGMMIHSMRSGTVIQPGEAQGCIGCHDDRKLAPHPTGARMPEAFMRAPDALNGWQGEPAKMFNYLAEVQPVFNAKCMSCHDTGGTGAAKVVLAGDKGICFNASYAELWRKKYTGAIGAGPAAIQQAKSWGSYASTLVQTILGSHTNRVTLTASEFNRIVTWVDLNAVYYPSYAANYPNNAGGRSPLSSTQLGQIATYTSKDVSTADSVKRVGELIWFDRPEQSPCLSNVTGTNYTNALALIQAGQAGLVTIPREDMTNCVLMNAIDLWRENKYQKRLFREAMNRAAVTAGAKVYDTQALLAVASNAPQGSNLTSVVLSGKLVYTVSNETAAVYIAWGTWDAGESTNLWEHVATIGTQDIGAFSLTLTNLPPGRPMMFRVFASNSQGLASSHVSTVFDTFSLLGMTPTPLTFTWSTNLTGVARDGAGTWNTSTANWTDSNDTHAVWCNVLGDTATFGAGGTAGTVTLDAGGITVGGLSFNAGVTGAYMLTGGPLLLTNTPIVQVDATAQIDSQISGTAGFTKTGASTLILSGSNTYSGVMAIETGTVKLAKQSLTIPTPTLWLDASNISTLATNANGTGAITVSGQPVGYWGDLSGNNRSAIQTILTNRPTYFNTVAEFNEHSVLQFDGVNDDLTSLLDINATNIPNLTLIIVYRQMAKTANGGLWGHDNGSWDRLQLLNFTAGGLYDGYLIATSGDRSPVKGMNTNAVLIYTAVLKNGVANGSYVYINGVSDANTGLPAFTSSEGTGYASLTLGNISAGNNYRGNIQIGEVLAYNTALSDSARVNVESYLRSKWLGAPEPTGAILPANSAVKVATGAALDLGGMEQAVASVSGSGTLSNGTLTVTQTLAPGNTNAIGMLTLPGSPIVNGATLLVDVAPNGSSDRLVVTGDLSLSDLSLQLANSGLLSAWRRYTLLTCSGTLTGEFLTNLPENWTIRYDRTAGTVTLYYPNSGTLINLM